MRRFVKPVWHGFELMLNVIDDSAVLTASAMGFWNHKDMFNLALFAGKSLKMIFFLHAQGFAFKSLDEKRK